MTEKCKHAWEMVYTTFKWPCGLCRECCARIDENEVNRRLNEYEILKAATERLSAEDARLWADRIEQYFRGAQIVDAFRAYADILEGKDD